MFDDMDIASPEIPDDFLADKIVHVVTGMESNSNRSFSSRLTAEEVSKRLHSLKLDRGVEL